VRKIGCGCDDCGLVDEFLTSRATEKTFRYVKARRLHVEEELGSASDLISFTVSRSGSPHGLLVTKQPALLAASSWKPRVVEAKKLLEKIGDEGVISKLMGHRYSDVVSALEGTQPFISTASDAVKFSRQISAGSSSQGMSCLMMFTQCYTKSPLSATTQQAAGTSITGNLKKRKRSESLSD
jgi:hypothetical protein